MKEFNIIQKDDVNIINKLDSIEINYNCENNVNILN